MLVALLGMAIFYVYALITFGFYRDFWPAVSGRHCRTMYECYISVIHHGLSNSLYAVRMCEMPRVLFCVSGFMGWKEKLPNIS